MPSSKQENHNQQKWKACELERSGVFLPDDGVLEAQLGSALLDLLLQPSLRSDQVLDKLRHPPDGGVAMQTLQTWSQVLRDGQRQVGGAWVQAVNYGQLDNLDVLIVSLSWGSERDMLGIRNTISHFCLHKKRTMRNYFCHPRGLEVICDLWICWLRVL